MTTLRFLKDCRDKYTGELYAKNSVKDFDDKRAAEISRSRFVEVVKVEPEAKKEPAKRGRKPKNN